MIWDDEMRKRVYDETASLIMTCFYQGKLNDKERDFLFNLLEEVFVFKARPDLLAALKKWCHANDADEVMQEIIMATMLAADFSKDDEIADLLAIINDIT